MNKVTLPVRQAVACFVCTYDSPPGISPTLWKKELSRQLTDWVALYDGLPLEPLEWIEAVHQFVALFCLQMIPGQTAAHQHVRTRWRYRVVRLIMQQCTQLSDTHYRIQAGRYILFQRASCWATLDQN